MFKNITKISGSIKLQYNINAVAFLPLIKEWNILFVGTQ